MSGKQTIRSTYGKKPLNMVRKVPGNKGILSKILATNSALRTILLTQGMVLLSTAMIGPIYALLVEDVGGSLFDAGVVIAVFAFFAGITVLIAGRYLDNIKNVELIVALGAIIIGIGFLGYIFVSNLAGLIIVEIILGIGEAIYAPSFDTLYTKHLDMTRIGSEWSLWESLEYFTTAVGAIIGGVLVSSFGFNVLFLIMGIFCIGSALYVYLLPRNYL